MRLSLLAERVGKFTLQSRTNATSKFELSIFDCETRQLDYILSQQYLMTTPMIDGWLGCRGLASISLTQLKVS